MARLENFIHIVKTSFLKVKNDVTDLTLRCNQLALTQSETVKEIKLVHEQLGEMKTTLARMRGEVEKNKIRTERNKALAKKKVVTIAKRSSKKVFIGSKTGGKVHVQECPFAKNINKSNRVFFSSRVKALRKGYTECKCTK